MSENESTNTEKPQEVGASGLTRLLSARQQVIEQISKQLREEMEPNLDDDIGKTMMPFITVLVTAAAGAGFDAACKELESMGKAQMLIGR